MMNFTGAYYGNGMPPAYQRLMEAQQFPQYQQQPQVIQQNVQPVINSSFVTNIQEAQAQPVGFNATNIAIDNTNNKIYLKRMDNNGVAITKTYIQQEDTPCPPISTLSNGDIEIYKNEIDGLKNEMSGLRESFNNYIINLSVELENVVNSSIENQFKKFKGEKNVQK